MSRDDPWADDHPAVLLGRVYLIPPPEPEVAQMGHLPTRRERIAALTDRVRAGDAAAAGQLSELLDELATDSVAR